MSRPGLLMLLLVVTACAGPSAVGELRFENRPPVWRVNDRLHTPEAPTQSPFAHKLYFFDALVHRRITHALEFHGERRAMNVNSLGEVPDSTWFTNRVGARPVSLEEIARGPNTDEGPDISEPMTVTGTKVGGKSVGLLAKDRRGVRYILKFDEPEVPVMETATDIVLCRLLWALGYNVPENDVVYLRREDFVLSETAVVKDTFGNERPMTPADLDGELAKVYRSPDGLYRTLASKYLSGLPIGGFKPEGVRGGDPNDTVPHQHRRELRGLHLIFGWLQQTDVKQDNTLDVWAEDPENPEHRYVVHYLVDFGKGLGANAYIKKHPGDGHAEVPDFELIGKSLMALGMWKRPFEGRPISNIEGVGTFDVAHYRPGHWKGNTPYMPFVNHDNYDLFWAAKIVMALTREQIRVAVEQGRYEDPRAEDAVTDILAGRQQRIGRYVFSRVNPLDRFEVSAPGAGTHDVCFEDLLLSYGLNPNPGIATEYSVRVFDYDGLELAGGKPEVERLEPGRVCIRGMPVSGSKNAYTIVSIATERGDRLLPPVELHLARETEGEGLRIVGINRR